MTFWLMKLFQSLLHYFLKSMVVNVTLSVFVLFNENLTFLERKKNVLPTAEQCDILPVLNHIGTACVSGI